MGGVEDVSVCACVCVGGEGGVKGDRELNVEGA